MTITVTNNNPDILRDIVVKNYGKEVAIQKRYGKGIKNPAAVVVNKIRHCCTDYDFLRTAMERREAGFQERMEFLKTIASKVDEIIDLIGDVEVGGVVIPIRKLKDSNKRYYENESSKLIHARFVHYEE